MDTTILIRELRRLIEEEIFRHSERHVNEAPIKLLLEAIAQRFLGSYETQREYVSILLSVYEEYTDHTFLILMTAFLNKMDTVKKLGITKLDLSIWDGDWDNKETADEFVSFLKSNIKRGQNIRLSEAPAIQVKPERAGVYLGVINRLITAISTKENFDGEDANSAIMQLWMARRLAISLGRKELFYLLINIFFDGLNFRQHYQFARDLSEECLLCAYEDGMPEYGYFLSFRVFADTSNSVTALHYAIFGLIAFHQKGSIIDYVLKNLYWVGIKFCRNIHMPPFAAQLFERRPTNVQYHIHENFKIHHAYFSSLFYEKDKDLPELVLNFIEAGKEEIISGGPLEVLPWLAILLNIEKNYEPYEYDHSQITWHMNLFKQIAGENRWKPLHTSLFGSLHDTQEALIAALVKLAQARNLSDFVTDNHAALLVSHRNIAEAFRVENPEAYLLSMILQSDFSISFQEKQVKGLVSVQQSFELRSFEDEYHTPQSLLAFVASLTNISILWLGADDCKIYPLYYDGSSYFFLKERVYSVSEVREFYRSNVKDLPHDEILPGNFRMEKGFADYAKEEVTLQQQLSFFNLPIDLTRTLLVIKDIQISSFPHNSLLARNLFVARSTPIVNINSLEWLIGSGQRNLNKSFSSAIWIPTESQDMAVNLMYSNMEEALIKYNFIQHSSIIPSFPLSSTINFVVAHGNERISTFPGFYLSNSSETFSIRSFDNIIGTGDILVLFVCHSGSQTNDFFRNQVSTAIKQFLQSGYSAVVAPFWALHINIPPIWLPEFIEALSAGDDVATATFRANRKVAAVYNTPKAYACLHLYGNPFIKIDAETLDRRF